MKAESDGREQRLTVEDGAQSWRQRTKIEDASKVEGY